MTFGGFNDKQEARPMADINVTPMVDVMLVLLVIFIISAPLLTHAIKLDLPTAKSAPALQKTETITLSINAQGKLFWNEQAITQTELDNKFLSAAQSKPLPDLQLRIDKSTRYEVIAQIMAAAQNKGLTKFSFVTESKASM